MTINALQYVTMAAFILGEYLDLRKRSRKKTENIL
jgi:hypothetical protein